MSQVLPAVKHVTAARMQPRRFEDPGKQLARLTSRHRHWFHMFDCGVI